MKIKWILTAAAMLISMICCQPEVSVVSAKAVNGTDNPFNRQDDMEVPYDGSRWIQPKDWNVPTVNPKDYKGGIMMYLDKVGLDTEYAAGTTMSIYFSIVGANEPVGKMKFHIFYDTRLKVKKNSQGEYVNAGKGVNGFTTGSAMIEEGQLSFYAVGNDTVLGKACIFTIDFIIPEDAQDGDCYPIGLAYTDDGIAADSFIKNKHDEAGRLQMTYLFTKGISNGYIRVGEKREKPSYSLGDVNKDELINAVDASEVLTYYAKTSVNKDGGFDDKQKLAADVDCDGNINAVDASCILAYYAYVSTTKEKPVSFEKYIGNI